MKIDKNSDYTEEELKQVAEEAWLLARLIDFGSGVGASFPRSLEVSAFDKSVVRTVCKQLREHLPHLKVKRVKEDGQSFVRLSLKDKGEP